MIKDLINGTEKQIVEQNIASLEDVKKAQSKLLLLMSLVTILKNLKKNLLRNIYINPQLHIRWIQKPK